MSHTVKKESFSVTRASAARSAYLGSKRRSDSQNVIHSVSVYTSTKVIITLELLSGDCVIRERILRCIKKSALLLVLLVLLI